MEDFAFQTNDGFYCMKNKCQKKAMAPLSNKQASQKKCISVRLAYLYL